MLPEHVVNWNPSQGAPCQFGPAVVSIGIFDGLHVGHRALLGEAADTAREMGCAFVVVTFSSDPDEYFGDASSFDKLLSDEERLGLLADVTSATVLSLPACREVFSLAPMAFLDLLETVCDPRAIFVGADFRFGAHAAGTTADIARWGSVHGCACHPRELYQAAGAPVTATRIRGLLKEGRASEARELLGGRPHGVEGTVVHGRGAGAGLGFATANLEIGPGQPMLPKEGVYGGYGIVGGRRYAAAINVGVAKSFEAATAVLEAHLLDFEGDLYGKSVKMEFVEWLREPRVFESQQELIATVTDNINWVRENLGGDALGSN